MERTRGEADRPTSHRCWPSQHADPLFKAGCVRITQVSVFAGVENPLSFQSRGHVHRVRVHCWTLELDPEGENRRSWSWRACSEATVKCFLNWGKGFKQLQHSRTRKLIHLPTCCWRRWGGDVAGNHDMGTGDLADIIFVVVDVVQSLKSILLPGVQSCVGGNDSMENLSARTCNVDYRDLLWKVTLGKSTWHRLSARLIFPRSDSDLSWLHWARRPAVVLPFFALSFI